MINLDFAKGHVYKHIIAYKLTLCKRKRRFFAFRKGTLEIIFVISIDKRRELWYNNNVIETVVSLTFSKNAFALEYVFHDH